LESRRLWHALVRPLPVLLAVAVTYGLLPGLGWAVSRLFETPDYRLGLLVVTSVPCTLVSAVIWTRRAGGDEATALIVTLLTIATSWLVTTAWLLVTTGAAVSVEAGPLMLHLFAFLIVPVALGQLGRWPAGPRAAATRFKLSISVLAQLLVVTIILKAVVMALDRLGTNVKDHVPALIGIALACVGMHLLAAAAGFWGGRLVGLDRGQCIAVAFSGSQKTLPVGVLLIDTSFPGFPLAVVPLLFYHVGQLLVDTLIADRFKAGKVLAEDEAMVTT